MSERKSQPSRLTPSQQAAELRRKADAALGAERDYLLWLAEEWEKTSARDGVSLSKRA